MKRLIWYTVATISLLSSISCEIGLDFINPAGDTKEVERTITGKITTMAIYDDVKVTVHFTEGSQYAVVRAGENIIQNIKADVSDSTITIRNDSKLEWTSSFKNKKEVTLYLNNTLTAIAYRGVDDVTFIDTVRTNTFSYFCDMSGGRVKIPLIANSCNVDQYSGISDLVMAGNCTEVTVFYKGTGWVYLQDLQVQNMVVTNNGTGDIFLNASNTLVATIKSIGNVIYTGSPQITLVKDGKGNLKRN